MVFLPGNLADADGLQEVHDILAPVVMGLSVTVLGHEDDGHVGKIGSYFPAKCRCPDRVLRDQRLDRYDGEGYALFDDYSTVNDHDNPSIMIFDSNKSAGK